jgi:hypothetical protein
LINLLVGPNIKGIVNLLDPLTKMQFLKDQLEKPTEDSKKWRMSIIGLKGVAAILLVTHVMIFFKPDLASHLATIAQFGLTAWGGIIALYLGAQGSVEYKTTAALEKIQKDENITIHKIDEKHLFVESEPGAPERRPWAKHDPADEEEAGQ